MDDELRDLLARLRDDPTIRSGVVEASASIAVPSILRELGWAATDTYVIEADFPVERGWVSYCLKVRGRSVVFIDLPRPYETLAAREEKLRYNASQARVPQAIVTNGPVWRFYLPVHDVTLMPRSFLTIDLRDGDVGGAASDFRRYLGSKAVADGTAIVDGMSRLSGDGHPN